MLINSGDYNESMVNNPNNYLADAGELFGMNRAF
jgi:hypothetical protein